MVKRWGMVAGAMACLVTGAPGEMEFLLSNPLATQRPRAPVSIRLTEDEGRGLPAPGLIQGALRDGTVLPVQADDLNGDSRADEAFLIMDFQPEEEIPLILSPSAFGPMPSGVSCHASEYRGLVGAWESEKILYGLTRHGTLEALGKRTPGLWIPVEATNYQRASGLGPTAWQPLRLPSLPGLGGCGLFLSERPRRREKLTRLMMSGPSEQKDPDSQWEARVSVAAAGPLRAGIRAELRELKGFRKRGDIQILGLIAARQRETEIRMTISSGLPEGTLAGAGMRRLPEEKHFKGGRTSLIAHAEGVKDAETGDVLSQHLGLGIIPFSRLSRTLLDTDDDGGNHILLLDWDARGQVRLLALAGWQEDGGFSSWEDWCDQVERLSEAFQNPIGVERID